MTPDERVWAAIALEEPDRVPVVPMLLPEPAANLAGVTQAEVAADGQKAISAVFDVYDSSGGWDCIYPAAYTPIQLQVTGIFPMKVKIPGRDLADDTPFQLDEAEVLELEDYDTIADIGYEAFFQEDFLWRITDLTREEVDEAKQQMLLGGASFLDECAKRDRRPYFLANAMHPFFTLSLMRSLTAFVQDIYYNPEPVERALRRMTDDLLASQVEAARGSGVRTWMCVEERAGGYFFSPEIFERFWMPYTQELVAAMWAEGIVTLFHLDSCWDKNLSHLRALPKGSAVLELDGTTDLRAAKEILGGHLCLKGDVPAALLSVGTPAEVDAYCQRRISEVGAGGGFILSTGCSVPAAVRAANFRALIDAPR